MAYSGRYCFYAAAIIIIPYSCFYAGGNHAASVSSGYYAVTMLLCYCFYGHSVAIIPAVIMAILSCHDAAIVSIWAW